MSFVSAEKEKELDQLWDQRELNKLRDTRYDTGKLSPVSEAVSRSLDTKFASYIEDLKESPYQTAIKTAKNSAETLYNTLMHEYDKPIGVAEVVATMMSGLFGALPGIVSGWVAMSDDNEYTNYFDAFHYIQNAATWEPKTEAGQEMTQWISDAYMKWIEEGYRGTVMDNYIGGLEKTGRINDPHERAVAAFLSILPDAVLMGSPFALKGTLKGRGRPGEGPAPLEGEWIGAEGPTQKGGPPAKKFGNVYDMQRDPELPAPMLDYQTRRLTGPEKAQRDSQAVQTNVRQLLDQGRPIEDVLENIKDAKNVDEAVAVMEEMRQSPPNGTIIKTWKRDHGRPMTANDFNTVTRGRWTTLIRINETGETATIPTQEYSRMVEESANNMIAAEEKAKTPPKTVSPTTVEQQTQQNVNESLIRALRDSERPDSAAKEYRKPELVAAAESMGLKVNKKALKDEIAYQIHKEAKRQEQKADKQELDRLWEEENKKLDEPSSSEQRVREIKNKKNKTDEEKAAIQRADATIEIAKGKQDYDLWMKAFDRTMDLLKDFEENPFIEKKVTDVVDAIYANAPKHLREGAEHFGSIEEYVQALNAELVKWEKLNIEALNELGVEGIKREFGQDLPGFVKDLTTASKILTREQPYRVIALSERIRQSVEFARDNGIKLAGTEKPKGFIDAIYESRIIDDVRAKARGELFKPRTASERLWRELDQDELGKLLSEIEQNATLMYYGAAEAAIRMSLDDARYLVDRFGLDTKGNKRVVLQRLKDNAPWIRKEINRELRARENLNLSKVRPTKDEANISEYWKRELEEDLKKTSMSDAHKRMLMADHIMHKGETLAKAELNRASMKDLRAVAKEFSVRKTPRSKEALVNEIIKTARGMREYTPGFDEHVAKIKITGRLNDNANLAKIFPRQAGVVDMTELYRVMSRLLWGPREGSKNIAALVHLTSRSIFNKHVTEIRRLRSSTAKRFAERMLPSDVDILSTRPRVGDTAEEIARQHTPGIQQSRGWFEDVRITQAKYYGNIERALAPFRSGMMFIRNLEGFKTMRLSMIHPKDAKQIKLGLQGHPVPDHLRPAVDNLRKVFDDFMVYLVDSDVFTLKPEAKEMIDRINELPPELRAQYIDRIRDIKLYGSNGYKENFFPHIWDPNKVTKYEAEFKQYLRDPIEQGGEGITDQSVINQIVSRIKNDEGILEFVESTENRFSHGQEFESWKARVGQHPGHAATPTFFMKRRLNGNSERALRFQENDIEAILNSYIYRGVIKAEYTKEFGRGEWKLNRMIRDIILEEEAYNNIDLKVAVRDPQQIAADIYDAVDAAQHRYGVIKNPRLRNLERGARGFTVIQQLGLVAVAQVPEYFVPLYLHRGAMSLESLRGTPLEWMKVPGKAYIDGTAALAQDFASWMSSLPTGKRLIPQSTLRQHLQDVGLASYGALEASAARWSGPVGTLSQRFLTLNLMKGITDHQRLIAISTIRGVIFDNARYLARHPERTSTKARMYRKQLRELGMNEQDAINWYNRGARENDPLFLNAQQTAEFRGVSRTIIEPIPGNIPKAINNQRLALAWLFSRFYSVFGNTVVKKWAQDMVNKNVTMAHKTRALTTIGLTVAIAYYLLFFRESISGYQLRDENDPWRVVDAVDRSGLFGGFSRFYHIFSPYKYAGGEYAITSMLGPFYGGTAPDIIETGQALFSDKPEVAARHIASNTPLITIHGEIQEETERELETVLKEITDYISDIEEALGLKK